ncbi:hypothetical protein D9M68_718520 [compost metagenome]
MVAVCMSAWNGACDGVAAAAPLAGSRLVGVEPMSSRSLSRRDRAARQARRWPLMGACLWLFLMTLLGAEMASGERARQGALPDEGYGQDAITGQTERMGKARGL